MLKLFHFWVKQSFLKSVSINPKTYLFDNFVFQSILKQKEERIQDEG